MHPEETFRQEVESSQEGGFLGSASKIVVAGIPKCFGAHVIDVPHMMDVEMSH